MLYNLHTMRSYLTFLIQILLVSTLNAQSVNWATNSEHEGNEAVNGIAQSAAGDRFIISMQNISTSFFRPIGEGMISKYDDDGTLTWNNPINGQLYASDIAVYDEHFWICGHIDSVMTYDGTETLGNGMFVMQCGLDGSLDWVYTNDSLLGHHSVLGVTPEGRPVVSGLKGWHDLSVLTELDEMGEVVRTKVLPESMISDFDIRENGDLAIGGNGFEVPNFDGHTVEDFISYPNFVALLNPDWETQWIYVSRYITFDHHHRVETTEDHVFFYALEGEILPLQSDVLVFSNTGALQDSIEINGEAIFHQMTEMNVHGNQLNILHAVSNSADPDAQDTLRITTYLPQEGQFTEYDITGEFPLTNEGRGLWKIDAVDCNTSVVGLTDFSTIHFGEQDDYSLEENNNQFVLASLDMNCAVNGLGEINSDIRMYPNPTNDVLYLENEKVFSTVIIRDITGRELVRRSTSRQRSQFDLSAFSEGIYLVEVDGRFAGKLVVR